MRTGSTPTCPNHYRDSLGSLLSRSRGGSPVRQDDINRQRNQFGGEPREQGRVATRGAEHDDDVASFRISEILQPPTEGLENRRLVAFGRRQNADPRDRRGHGLLRQDRSRAEEETCKESGDERAPSHSITSSARASKAVAPQ
jgi:hypothetical protein